MCIECFYYRDAYDSLLVTGTMDFYDFPIINWDITVFLMGYNGI